MDVAAVACDSALDALYEQVGGDSPLILHLGVHQGRKGFGIECQAVNLLDSWSVDAYGNACTDIILDDSQDKEHTHQTKIDVDDLVSKLKGKGFECSRSEDAGKYLCNYVYYQSMRRCVDKDARVLFVHVPGLDDCDIETMKSFVAELIKECNA